MTDCRSLSADELWAALGQADRTVDLDLIRACLERREELTPALLAALEDGPDLGWADDDSRWFLEIHAGFLLCACREPAALPVFGRVCSVSSWSLRCIPSGRPAGTALVWVFGTGLDRAYHGPTNQGEGRLHLRWLMTHQRARPRRGTR